MSQANPPGPGAVPQGRRHWVTFGVEMEFLLDFATSSPDALQSEPPGEWYNKSFYVGKDTDDIFCLTEAVLTTELPTIIRDFLITRNISCNPTLQDLMGPPPPGQLYPGQQYPDKYDNWSIEEEGVARPQDSKK